MDAISDQLNNLSQTDIDEAVPTDHKFVGTVHKMIQII
jgi:hypothetical protein